MTAVGRDERRADLDRLYLPVQLAAGDGRPSPRNTPTLWPHLARPGLAGALWIVIIIRLSARLFRQTVLKSSQGGAFFSLAGLRAWSGNKAAAMRRRRRRSAISRARSMCAGADLSSMVGSWHINLSELSDSDALGAAARRARPGARDPAADRGRGLDPL